MNLQDAKYNQFALVREMFRTSDIIRNFDFSQTVKMVERIAAKKKLFLTGEGSSRIFPAKSLIYGAYKRGLDLTVATEGCLQAMDYDLSDWAVIAASNSGQTKEMILLYKQLEAAGHADRFGVTANSGTRIIDLTAESIVLSCGKEDAVAATMSVVEQALVYRSILCNYIKSTGKNGIEPVCECPDNKEKAADLSQAILEAEYDPALIGKIAKAPLIYLSGRNTGVSEELALKTNEITRKKSQYLEGTIVVHGIEEVMTPEEVVVLIDPFESEYDKITQSLIKNIGMTVIAISTKDTPFNTIKIPELKGYNLFFQLMAGWNLLVQTGVACNVNLDKPQRARKIGNEFTE